MKISDDKRTDRMRRMWRRKKGRKEVIAQTKIKREGEENTNLQPIRFTGLSFVSFSLSGVHVYQHTLTPPHSLIISF